MDKLSLTRREQEALEFVTKNRARGCGVWDLAEAREITYPSAYGLLESLREKGVVKEEWAKKGNKKFYRPLK